MTRSEAILQLLQLLRRLAGAQALEHEQRIDDLAVGEGLAQHAVGIDRQESEFDADAARLRRKLAHDNRPPSP